MGDSLGKQFVVTSFGESHGRCVGMVVQGCPAGLPLDASEVQKELDRRRPVEGAGSTPRAEEDRVEILAGLFEGVTTGAPIAMVVWNRDVQSEQYEKTRFVPRPGMPTIQPSRNTVDSTIFAAGDVSQAGLQPVL